MFKLKGRERRLGMMEEYLSEAEDYLAKGDPVQASEKLYKVAEEAIKILAEIYELPEWEEAVNAERWSARLLFSAVDRLATRLGERVRDLWNAAWFLHVEGFHEMRLTIEQVKKWASRVRELAELASSSIES